MCVPFSDTTGASRTVASRSALYRAELVLGFTSWACLALMLGLLGPFSPCLCPRVGLRESRGDAPFGPSLRPLRSSQHFLELRDRAARQQHIVEAQQAQGIDFPGLEHQHVGQVAR